MECSIYMEELYDLKADAAERTSLTDRKQLARWRSELNAFALTGDRLKQTLVAPDVREQLAGSSATVPA